MGSGGATGVHPEARTEFGRANSAGIEFAREFGCLGPESEVMLSAEFTCGVTARVR
jgi:hypothetical protein